MAARLLTWAGLLGMGIGTGVVSLTLGAAHFGMPMFYAYFNAPALVALNLLPPVLLLFFLWFATGRAWIAFSSGALLIFAMSTINFFKIQIRSEPFIAADFYLIGEAGESVTTYVPLLNWKLYLAAAVLLGGAVFALLALRYRPGGRVRVIGMAAVLLVALFSYRTWYLSEKLYSSVESGYPINIWSTTERSITRGFLYPFIYSIRGVTGRPPQGYSGAEATAALAAYGDGQIPGDKKVNVVSVMLESYADLTTLGALDFTKDVYGPLHALQEESVHGSLIVNVFAGGTIDTERSFLTGYTKLGDFQKPSNSYVRYLSAQGYYTEGLHVGDGWFYDRKTVHPNLGFHNYYFLEDYEDSNRWDAFFFSKVIELYESRETERPYFSYSLSYQNHGPYDAHTPAESDYISRGDLSEESFNIINNYLEGVYDTTRRTADFIDYFRQDDEPVVVVLFGDHMPWLGNAHSVYHELGVNLDLATREGFYNLYATPYLIWANDAAKAVLGDNFTGYGGDFSPCFLMNALFERCGWSGDAFMKAADELREHVTVINGPTGYYLQDGVLGLEPTGAMRDICRRFDIVQYYRQQNLSD